MVTTLVPPAVYGPSDVPEGYKAHWNTQYNAWFYENIYTGVSVWVKPLKPAGPPQHTPPPAPNYQAAPAETDYDAALQTAMANVSLGLEQKTPQPVGYFPAQQSQAYTAYSSPPATNSPTNLQHQSSYAVPAQIYKEPKVHNSATQPVNPQGYVNQSPQSVNHTLPSQQQQPQQGAYNNPVQSAEQGLPVTHASQYLPDLASSASQTISPQVQAYTLNPSPSTSSQTFPQQQPQSTPATILEPTPTTQNNSGIPANYAAEQLPNSAASSSQTFSPQPGMSLASPTDANRSYQQPGQVQQHGAQSQQTSYPTQQENSGSVYSSPAPIAQAQPQYGQTTALGLQPQQQQTQQQYRPEAVSVNHQQPAPGSQLAYGQQRASAPAPAATIPSNSGSRASFIGTAGGMLGGFAAKAGPGATKYFNKFTGNTGTSSQSQYRAQTANTAQAYGAPQPTFSPYPQPQYGAQPASSPHPFQGSQVATSPQHQYGVQSVTSPQPQYGTQQPAYGTSQPGTPQIQIYSQSLSQYAPYPSPVVQPQYIAAGAPAYGAHQVYSSPNPQPLQSQPQYGTSPQPYATVPAAAQSTKNNQTGLALLGGSAGLLAGGTLVGGLLGKKKKKRHGGGHVGGYGEEQGEEEYQGDEYQEEEYEEEDVECDDGQSWGLGDFEF